jgi:hypothetical protein
MPIKLDGSGFWPAVIKHVVLNGDEVKKVYLDGVEVFPSYAPSETFTVYLVCEARLWGHVVPQYGDEYYKMGYKWSIYHTSSVARRFNGIDIEPGKVRVLNNHGYDDDTRSVEVKSPFTKTIDVTSVVWRKPDKYGDPDDGYDVWVISPSQWTIDCRSLPTSYEKVGYCEFQEHHDGDPNHFNVYWKVEMVNIRTNSSYCIYDIKTTISHTADMDLTFDNNILGRQGFVVHEGQEYTSTEKDLYWFWDTQTTKSTYELWCAVPHKDDTGVTTRQKMFDSVAYDMSNTSPHTITEQTKTIDYIV